MVGNINKVILIGELASFTWITSTQAGDMVATFDLVTSESWNDRASGKRRERTERHQIVIFSQQLAYVAMRYLSKGAKVYVEGQLRTRRWQDQDGREQATTEIVLSQAHGELVMLDRGRGVIRRSGRASSC